MSSTPSPHQRLAVAFEGTGRHPASRRESVARARDLIGSPETLDAFAGKVVPLLQEQGVFRTEYESPTLRHHLGLARPDDDQDEQRVAS
ncbi:hypothetical protein TUSST3_29200 [Streptomyces sp. TUS-ST3]|nr:hypothetical protein TUSST3_29200 [Streptomyces sp. TUS-ST3]